MLVVEQPAIVTIHPDEVDLVFGPPSASREERIALKRELLQSKTSVRAGDWDTPADRAFTELEVFQALEDRILQNRAWHDTPFYERVLQDLARGRRKWGCSTEQEFAARCASLDRLHTAISQNGFQTQEELQTGRLNDEIRLGVRRDGRLLFIDGRHRLAIARILGLTEIPVHIAVRHAHWADFKQEVLDYAVAHHGRVYQQVDHPDLNYIPAGHGTERITIIMAALSPYAGQSLSVLDIGAHWGYMCQQLERVGFACQGVERNRQSAQIATRISEATNSSFTVWHGSVFEYPRIEEFDVVLALNVFHHFIKTEQLHNRFERLLGRIRSKILIFEAHKHDPPAQMAGAFRNYAPHEFVDFICRHAGFSRSEHIGTAQDGRLLFKLWR